MSKRILGFAKNALGDGPTVLKREGTEAWEKAAAERGFSSQLIQRIKSDPISSDEINARFAEALKRARPKSLA